MFVECLISQLALTASTFLGKYLTSGWKLTVGICSQSDARASLRSGTDVEQCGLAHSQSSDFSKVAPLGLDLGFVLARQDLPYEAQYILYGPCFGHRGIVML